MQQKNRLKRQIVIAAFSVLLTFVAVSAATFAWYIYNTNAHTTSVHMAAGSGTNGGGLLINDSYYESDGHTYGLSAGMKESGILNPVSTNNILNGFRKVYGYTDGSDTRSMIANLFGKVVSTDYYRTSLYFKCNGGDDMDLYLGYLTYEDADQVDPISAAMRVGFVVYPSGTDPDDMEADPTELIAGCTQQILAINPNQHISDPHYNTSSGDASRDYTLDSSLFTDLNSDVPTIEMVPFNGVEGNNILYKPNNYYYTSPTPEGALPTDTETRDTNTNRMRLGNSGAIKGDGTPTRVDVYVWLEGVDPDCYDAIASGNLDNMKLEFVGIPAN